MDLVKLLTNIKNTLISCINWCQKLNDDEEIKNKVLELQQSINDIVEQMQCYKNLVQIQINLINNLEIENQELKKDIFTSKYII